MNFASLDMIVNRGLLERNLPNHWYIELLIHASTCLRELTFDTLQIVNTVQLPINEYGAADLPDGVVDDIGCYYAGGGTLVPIPHSFNQNPLRMIDSTGAFTQQSTNPEQATTFPFVPYGWVWFWNVNDYGQGTGRLFGLGGGTQNGYEIFRERRQIQLNNGATDGSIIFMFMSDGQNIDNASQIDQRAIQTIRAYQDWKMSPNALNDNSPEGRHYYNQKRLLRARLNPLTAIDIKNIIRQNQTLSIKR